MGMKFPLFIFSFLVFTLFLSSISATPTVSMNVENPGEAPYVELYEFPTNATYATYWLNFSDPSEIPHNDLGGLQGGTISERYHLNQSVFDYLMSNIFSFLTSISNIFDQSLNTTDNVTFANVTADYYFGDGSKLTGIAFNDTDTHVAGDGNYLTNDSTTMFFNETKMNDTIRNLAEVRSYEENVTITTSGGNGGNFSSSLDFQITQITVYPNSLTHPYRFEATETTSGDIIDKDRQAHIGVWDIVKAYALNDTVTLNITSSTPDDTYTIKITYLDNFRP